MAGGELGSEGGGKQRLCSLAFDERVPGHEWEITLCFIPCQAGGLSPVNLWVWAPAVEWEFNLHACLGSGVV